MSLLLLILCLSMPPAAIATAQIKAVSTKDTEVDITRLRQQLSRSVQHVADTTLQGRRLHLDHLASSTTAAVDDTKRQLLLLIDSLITNARDSLDAARQDSLRLTGKSLEPQILSFISFSTEPFSMPLSKLTEVLAKTRIEFSSCEECESNSDFESRLADFKEFADSISSAFNDTTSSLFDEYADSLLDTYETARDSLLDTRDNLIDNRLNDIDIWRYSASRIVLSSGYSSHNSYRGRDNGLEQHAFTPSLVLRHSSGISITGSASSLSNAPQRWDNYQLMTGYDFRFSQLLGGTLAYAHFWFSDSSRSELSVFTDNVQGGLSLDWPLVSFAALGSMNFGKASEFTMTTSISHDIEIPLNLYDQITMEPTFSWVIGEQNGVLTTLRTTKLKGKRVITTQHQATNTFGVLDYEASLPMTLEIGPVTLAPAVTYIVPLNVVDASTTKPFMDFDIGISVTFR